MSGRSSSQTGIIALVVLTFIYGLTAVMARYFSTDLGVFTQWYLRFFFALLLMTLVLRKKIRFNALLHVSRREHLLVAVRGLVGFVLAAGLYALSTQYTTIASVAVMQVVPTTAIFGWLLLREHVALRKGLLIAASFVGAALVAMKSGLQLHFGAGEMLSLVSGALFSLTFVLRKKQTGELNNYELAFLTTAYGFAGNYIAHAITNRELLPDFGGIGSSMWLLLIGAGLLSVFMSLLASYGFEHVKATTASIILDLELVFGVVLGYLLYAETMTLQQTIGALVILAAASTIGFTEAKKTPLGPNPE